MGKERGVIYLYLHLIYANLVVSEYLGIIFYNFMCVKCQRHTDLVWECSFLRTDAYKNYPLSTVKVA